MVFDRFFDELLFAGELTTVGERLVGASATAFPGSLAQSEVAASRLPAHGRWLQDFVDMSIDALPATLFDNDTHPITRNRFAHPKSEAFLFILWSDQGFESADTTSAEIEVIDVDDPFGTASRASRQVDRGGCLVHRIDTGVDVRRCPTMIIFVAAACLVTVTRQPQ